MGFSGLGINGPVTSHLVIVDVPLQIYNSSVIDWLDSNSPSALYQVPSFEKQIVPEFLPSKFTTMSSNDKKPTWLICVC